MRVLPKPGHTWKSKTFAIHSQTASLSPTMKTCAAIACLENTAFDSGVQHSRFPLPSRSNWPSE